MVKLFWLALVPIAFAAVPLNETYREPAQKLIAAALADNGGYAKLSYLCDRIGNRLSGSEALNRAIEWASSEMKKDGLRNVVTPEVMVPHWVRGRERLTILAPVEREVAMLGLGDSVGTPKAGLTADVVAVATFEELDRIGRTGVEGKIVLFNAPYVSYGETNRYRTQGPSRAARLGAVGSLVRSITPVSLQSPHTGQTTYLNDVPRIPAAAVTIEGALMIQRLIDSGTNVRVRLQMEARMEADAKSANIMGEIPGREKPGEIVVIGGHIDSWDVGQGAQDDGSGCVTAMQAAAIINKLGLKPRRTIRVVLWTNEENGGAGGRAYRKWVGDAIGSHYAAIEMDGGAEKPTGFGISEGKLTAAATEIVRLLAPVGANAILPGGGGADIDPLMKDGVPGLALRTTGQRYFEWHHTESDTVDKVNPEDLRSNIAAMAVMAYVLADMPD